jgi:phage terminase small subunit
MVRELTGKQREFCKCIVEGKTNIDSYMTAYNCTNYNTANVESTKLLKRDDITAYIQELYKPIKNTIANTEINERKKQIQEIKDRIEICKQKDDETSLIRYYDMLNKIYGCYKETDQETKQENTIDTLDTATLIKLSGSA